MKQAFPAHPEVPISKAMRAGDFVFTSAYGPWTFDPAKVTFNEIYKTYFKSDPPVRSVFPRRFMFSCKVEIKVIANKPLIA